MWRHPDEPAARLDRSGSHSPPRVRPRRQARLPRHASSKADERATSLNVRQDPPYSGTSDAQASERARPTPARAVPLRHLGRKRFLWPWLMRRSLIPSSALVTWAQQCPEPVPTLAGLPGRAAEAARRGALGVAMRTRQHPRDTTHNTDCL